MNNIEKPKKLNVEGEIGIIRQQCAAIGANDSEFDRLDGIEKAYRNKEITREEAIQKAREVLDSKQDYH